MIVFKKLQQVMETITQQQTLDADPKAIQLINLASNLENNAIIFFNIEEAKETIFNFSQRTVRVF